MKLLLIHSFDISSGDPKFNAISYHRILTPHRVLSRNFPEYECHHVTSGQPMDEEFLANFDLVLFLRFIEDMSLVPMLKKLNIPFGIDEDDYWVLPKNHVAYEAYQANKLTNKIAESIKVCDFVICTTPILRDKIAPLNPNVHIIENGIDTMDSSWIPNKTKSDRIRFGFLGGSTHIYDIYKISHGVVDALNTPLFKKKGQVCLAHHYVPGEPSNYVGYEKLLTDHFKCLDYDYRKGLVLGTNPDGTNQPYRRLKFKPVNEFATLYNDIDVSVSPLEDTEFNSCKSELKMLEAGFMNCAIMLSNVNPYSLICNKDNSFMFDRGDFKYWANKIIKEPNMIEDKKAALKETIAGYELAVLSIKRDELYKSLKR